MLALLHNFFLLGGGGETREAAVYRIAADMLDKLPRDYKSHEVRDRLRIMGHLQPLNIFLKQEIDRMQRVIGTVRSTLTDLALAIDGSFVFIEARPSQRSFLFTTCEL